MSLNIAEEIGQAVHYVRTGALQQAADIGERILRAAPSNFDALHLLGVIRGMQGDAAEAIRLLSAAVAANPASNFAHFNLAKALADCGRDQESLAHHERAVALGPDHAEAWLNYGRSLRILGRPEEAAAAYGRAVALRPQAASGWSGRAEALSALRRHDKALADLDRALALAPGDADVCYRRARTLDRLGRRVEALAAYDRVVALDPARVEAWAGRGGALHELERHAEACADYDRALALDPRRAEVWTNRGAACNELRQYEQAVASLDRALTLNAGYAEPWFNRGIAHNALKRYAQARDDFARALALRPDLPYAEGFRLQAKMMLCDWAGLADAWTRAFARIEAGERVAYPFVLLATPAPAALQRRCCEIYLRDRHPAHPAPVFSPLLRADGRIRIGYFSADFHRHATAWLIAGLFERHDRARFELIGFSFGPPSDDDMRRRIAAACDRFIDVRDKGDAEVAVLARQLGVDIAVDLKGVTQDARPGIFAHRAAPIQVNYLGYPGTLAAAYMDYLIADRIVIPPEQAMHYAEKIVYLPVSYQVNDAGRRIAERTCTRAEAGLPEAGFVFCCFNNNYKITPDVFDVWMRLLAQVPGSVLWLYRGNEAAARNLRDEAARRGVSPERLVFAGHSEVSEHLARHRLADLFLDTFHYNAHTTASDALWAGVPVLTCLGDTFAGRVAASLLTAAGLPELVARAPAEYEALALALATRPARLAELRDRLARQRAGCPLFDTARFARGIETAYAAMWQRHCAGLPPACIDITDLGA